VTGFYYKILPWGGRKKRRKKKGSSHYEKPPPGLKKQRRETMLVRCKPTGQHKYSLYSLANPLNQGFSNTFPSLPILYKAERSVWIDCDLFKQWIFVGFTSKTEKFLKMFLAKLYWYQKMHFHIQMKNWTVMECNQSVAANEPKCIVIFKKKTLRKILAGFT